MIKRNIGIFLKVVLVQMLISICLVFVLAFVVLKTSLTDSVIKVFVLIIYAISAFVGGVIVGKVRENRKFLWGMAMGGLYIVFILFLAFIIKGSVNSGIIGIASGIITALLAGTIGGMLS